MCVLSTLCGNVDKHSPFDIYIYIIFELNVFGPCGQSHAVQFAWSSAPPWSRTLRKHHPLMIRGRAWSSFDVIVPWVRLLVSRARRRTFEMALYHTSIILDISLSEKAPQSENWTISSIITGQFLIGMITSFAWDCNLHTASAHGWMWLVNTNATHSFASIGKTSTPDQKWQKWSSTVQICQKAARDLLYIVRGGSYWNWYRSLPAVMLKDRTVGAIPLNWPAVYMFTYCNIYTYRHTHVYYFRQIKYKCT